MRSSRLHAAVPGVLLASGGGGAALAAHALAPWAGTTLVAIVLGLALGTAGRVGAAVRPGLALVARHVLRAGVALLGLQLVLGDVLALGWPLVAVVVVVVAGGIAGTLLLARALGVPAEQGLLVACGFSICGAAAVAAVDGVRRSRDEDVAVAVSLVVVFGSLTMLAVPAAAALLGLGEAGAGAWAGAAVHEVGQVVVAGGLVGGAALQVAVVVKLGRVLLLAPVLAVVSLRVRRTASAAGRRPPLVPGFVLAFVALVVLRSTVAVPAPVLDVAGAAQEAALAAAMFALGCAIDPRALRRTGRRVVALAAGATATVALLGLPAAFLVG